MLNEESEGCMGHLKATIGTWWWIHEKIWDVKGIAYDNLHEITPDTLQNSVGNYRLPRDWSKFTFALHTGIDVRGIRSKAIIGVPLLKFWSALKQETMFYSLSLTFCTTLNIDRRSNCQRCGIKLHYQSWSQAWNISTFTVLIEK